MSVHHFEGIAVTDDMADIHYLSMVHALGAIGELTVSQERAGGLLFCSHGQRIETRPVEVTEPEKTVPNIYFGRIALQE